MASPLTAAGPATASADDAPSASSVALPASPASSTATHDDGANNVPDTASASSRGAQGDHRNHHDHEADGDAAHATATAPCPWATRLFHDQECARYFDCPSHTVERRLSNDQTEEPQELPARPVFKRDESSHDLYGDRDTSRPESTEPSQESESEMAASAEDSDDELTLGEWLASRSTPDTPGLAQTITPPQGPATMQHAQQSAEPGPSALRLAQSQSSLPSSRSSYNEMEQGRERSSQATARLPQTPRTSIVPTSAPTYPSAAPRARGSSSLGQGGQTPPQGVQRNPHLPEPPQPQDGSSRSSEFVLPRWQPDAEVTYCPICHTQFSFFVRKHHCRKCGRVVCNACSPHRIIIPHQYIVRPPGSEMPVPQSLLMDSLGVGYIDVNGISGGERVRLCNPCVPDPNTAPPQHSSGSPTTPSSLSPRSSHQRSRSSLGDAYAAATSTNRYGVVFASGQSHDPFQSYAPRNRSISINSTHHAIPGPSSSRHRTSMGAYPGMGRYPSMGNPSTSVPSYPGRYGALRTAPSSSRQRALPPTPQIAEEDECPICHRELPQRSLPNFEALREAHITSCIQSHSTYGSPRPTPAPTEGGAEGSREQDSTPPPPPPRRTGMYTYPATEKDCIDDAECTICLEEFTVGIPMARLECLCRFHRSCIAAWFVKHPGRCPVHQHDGFGY